MDDDLKKLLAENLRKTEEIYQITQKLKNYLFWGQIISVLRLLLIVVPVILAIIYLPPFISDLLKQYQGLLGRGGLKL
ncbi:MAG: hypothetical protein WCT37_02685 [Patescibacteria group bacterium]|jgi:hypothetical protein